MFIHLLLRSDFLFFSTNEQTNKQNQCLKNNQTKSMFAVLRKETALFFFYNNNQTQSNEQNEQRNKINTSKIVVVVRFVFLFFEFFNNQTKIVGSQFLQQQRNVYLFV